MAERSDAVMSLVESELKKNPDASTQELYEKAAGKHPEVKKLTLRQFNARYPLQVKRQSTGRRKKKAQASRPSTRGRKPSKKDDSERREKVRGVLLSFAKDLTASDERGNLVKVLADIDKYVDRIESF